MHKQSHQILMDYLKQVMPEIYRDGRDIIRQTDNVVVWITGLATGAIALILTQKFAIFSVSALKFAVGFFLMAIICGVVFRALTF